MIAVIQCAATKRADAGCYRDLQNRPVLFVADPSKAPPSDRCVYARPDDDAEGNASWRDLLVQYNQTPGNNPFGLLPAIDLYENNAYHQLAAKVGRSNTYILSAGWGLIPADFLTPAYDITFSAAADAHKRRRRAERYRDLCMLSATDQPVLFFGGKDYVPLFCELTKHVSGPRTVFYNSARPPAAPGCLLHRFDTSTRTNWHYECVRAFVAGDFADSIA